MPARKQVLKLLDWLQSLSRGIQQRGLACPSTLLCAHGISVHVRTSCNGAAQESGAHGLAARRLRDERMVDLGVRMEDVKVGAGTGSVWKLEDPALLRAEVRAVSLVGLAARTNTHASL